MKYAQNNFKQSAVAKQSESSKGMVWVATFVLVAVAFAFQSAIGA